MISFRCKTVAGTISSFSPFSRECTLFIMRLLGSNRRRGDAEELERLSPPLALAEPVWLVDDGFGFIYIANRTISFLSRSVGLLF